jgi:hypothetical protein
MESKFNGRVYAATVLTTKQAAQVDKVCKELFITRSAWMRMVVVHALTAHKAAKAAKVAGGAA